MLWVGTVKNRTFSWRGCALRYEDLCPYPSSVIADPPVIACAKLDTCTSVLVYRSFQTDVCASKAAFHFTSCLETASELCFSVHHLPRKWGRALEVPVPVPFRYRYRNQGKHGTVFGTGATLFSYESVPHSGTPVFSDS